MTWIELVNQMKGLDVTPEAAEEAANMAKHGIFLVVQNIDSVWGRVFVRGVVIAETPEQAIRKMLDHLVEVYLKSDNGGVVFETSLVTAFEIGRLVRRPQGVGKSQDHLKDSDVLTTVVIDTAGPAALQTGAQALLY
jgi:hypothetical protein